MKDLREHHTVRFKKQPLMGAVEFKKQPLIGAVE